MRSLRGIDFIAIVMAIVFCIFPSKAKNVAFDNIRPLASEGLNILLMNGDSIKAMSLLTEALVRGQDCAESEEEINLMASIVASTITLRSNLKNESVQRLMLELMLGSQVSIVNKDKNSFGGKPEKLPAFDENSDTFTDESIAYSIRKAVELMAKNRLKECEKLLISLYTHTWIRGKNIEWRHPVANKLGILYLKLATPEDAIHILRQNKIDMDKQLNPDRNADYCETILYLAHAYRQSETHIIWKCFLETANEIAARNNLYIEPIIDDFKQIFLVSGNMEQLNNDIADFIQSNDNNLSFLTESQREMRWESLQGSWKNLKYSLLDSAGNVKDINACLNAFQYEKQIMLRSAIKTMETLRKTDDKEAISLTDSLIAMRRKLASCFYFEQDEIMAQYEQIQKTLLHHYVMNGFENHLYRMLAPVDIASKLEENETFVDFGTLETNEGERYYAIVVSPKTPKGKVIPLCTVKEFEKFMKYTEDPEARKTVEKRYDCDFLYNKIWMPLYSDGLMNKKIYYCPTGMLGLIMPEAITHHGRYVGEDFEFHIVSSAEELDRAHAGRNYKPKSLYSFCAIDYYCDRLALIANAQLYGSDKKIYIPSLERDSDIGLAFSDAASIPPLHNPEDFGWVRSLGEKYRVLVSILTGHHASEHALKSLSGGEIGILNIVTHAYSMPKTLQPLEKPYFTSLTIKTRFNDKMEREILPLYRTGFMLSGAERAWCRRNVISGIEDGVVNGEELAALDLHGVDLITLIACDTGSGDIDSVEGIMGLRRALKMAGCKTLVTTAWNLDKEAGDAYLQEFYTNLMEGSGIPEAHRRAQLELLKRFDNPYYWAVFQLID